MNSITQQLSSKTILPFLGKKLHQYFSYATKKANRQKLDIINVKTTIEFHVHVSHCLFKEC